MHQICVSKFNHPEQTEGQHTNGPPTKFIKKDGGRWYIVEVRLSDESINQYIEKYGFEQFVLAYCSPLGDVA